MFGRLDLATVWEEILIMGNVTFYVSLEPSSPDNTFWCLQSIIKIVCESSLMA